MRDGHQPALAYPSPPPAPSRWTRVPCTDDHRAGQPGRPRRTVSAGAVVLPGAIGCGLPARCRRSLPVRRWRARTSAPCRSCTRAHCGRPSWPPEAAAAPGREGSGRQVLAVLFPGDETCDVPARSPQAGRPHSGAKDRDERAGVGREQACAAVKPDQVRVPARLVPGSASGLTVTRARTWRPARQGRPLCRRAGASG